MADLIKAKVWLLGKCDLCGTPIDRIEREGTTVWHFHVAPEPVSGMPHTPTPGCTCHPTDESTWTRYGSAVEPGSMWEPNPECPEHGAHTEILAAQERAGDTRTADADSGRGTGVAETLTGAQEYENGRRIAVSMMDRAEAKHRHANGTPHLREHCETCAEEYWSNRLRPVHNREAAASLRAYVAAQPSIDPDDRHACGYRDGIIWAAERLESVAKDDESDSLTERTGT
ncbi:hypothetical protein [Glycomyces paridis]|uniref:Uncharacterized protein n=1 Tax=Glycomyces paridis TaxID=2126555 RepID=A0A4S8PCL8_9ACTN|nr:hypothetical protein [Glycomyces paridis]THV25989.1 hypothetical protein E9998_19845 [Glycomyces paridis]